MPTITGVVFCLCGIYCFLYREDALLGLLIVSAVFEASSAVNIAERGIQPYYLIAGFIIVRALVNRTVGTRTYKHVPQGKWLLLFGAVAVSSALLCPVIFAGVPIYDPKIGIDEGFFVRPPLQFSVNNIIQPAYLMWHVCTVFALPSIEFSAAKTRKAFLAAFYIESAFVCAESLCQLLGISFPLWIVLNNPGYSLWENSMEAYGTRNPGTFAEPSLAGAFLVLFSVAFLAEYFADRQGVFRVMLALLVSALIASSSSLVVLGVVPLALMVRYSPFRFPWYINLRRAKKVIWISLLIIGPLVAALVVFSGYRAVLTNLTVSKGDTGSFIHRTASDLYGLELVRLTYGMGVGLGSSRSSSLVATLLSNVGVLGAMAFAIFYFKLFKGLAKNYAWLRWAAVAFLINVCIGLPDITMPVFWIPIFLAITCGMQERRMDPATRRLSAQACSMT